MSDDTVASTVGTWLQSSTFGPVCRFDAATETALIRMWRAGAGPGDARMRTGSVGSGRGAQRFVRETIGRVRHASASGRLVIRMDAWSWSRKAIQACVDHDAQFSITVARQPVIIRASDAIDEDDWLDIASTDGGTAQVAEATWDNWRLNVCRTRLVNSPGLAALSTGWRHHAFNANAF